MDEEMTTLQKWVYNCQLAERERDAARAEVEKLRVENGKLKAACLYFQTMLLSTAGGHTIADRLGKVGRSYAAKFLRDALGDDAK